MIIQEEKESTLSNPIPEIPDPLPNPIPDYGSPVFKVCVSNRVDTFITLSSD